MARLTDKQREDIINQFHLGISQYQLAKDFDVSPATVNKLVKGLTPKLKEKVNEAVAIKSALFGESERLVNAFESKVNEICRFRGIIQNLTEKALKKADDILESGTVEEKINIGDGMQKFEQRTLNTNDIKNIVELSDKASITLGVNPRGGSVEVNNANIIQENKKIEIVVE